jgi:hypothetical protein
MAAFVSLLSTLRQLWNDKRRTWIDFEPVALEKPLDVREFEAQESVEGEEAGETGREVVDVRNLGDRLLPTRRSSRRPSRRGMSRLQSGTTDTMTR